MPQTLGARELSLERTGDADRDLLAGSSHPAANAAPQSQAKGQVEAFPAVLPWLPCTAEELGKQERGEVT